MTQIPCLFFFFFFLFFFLFFYHVLCINNLREQRLRAALAMVKKEPHPILPPNTREKAINPSLSGTRPTARQPRKIRNQTPTEGAEQENQINTRGGINRKTLAVDTINKRNNCYNHCETQSNWQWKKNNGGTGATKTVAALQALLVNPRRWHPPPGQCNTTTERNRGVRPWRNRKVRRNGSRVPAKWVDCSCNRATGRNLKGGRRGRPNNRGNYR